MGLTFAQLDGTPIGPISFVAGDQGLRGVAFTTIPMFKSLLNQTEGLPSLNGLETVGKLLVEFNAYFSGLQPVFTVDIDWDSLDGFQQQVLRVTYAIPYGEVLSYGAVARKLGKPGAARAVGAALGSNPMPIVIPCHRVVGSDHGLHGYLGGEKMKAFLLTLEGHSLRNQKLARA